MSRYFSTRESDSDDDGFDASDVFSLFDNDTEKALKAHEKINKAKIEAERLRQIEFKKQKMIDAEKNKEILKKNGLYQYRSAYRSPALYSNDPLIGTMQGGRVPPLPPPPPSIYDDIAEDDDDNDNDNDDKNEKTLSNAPDPRSKKSVGKQFGISIEVPKTPLPTKFVNGAPYSTPRVPQGIMHNTPPFMGTPYGYPQYSSNDSYTHQMYPIPGGNYQYDYYAQYAARFSSYPPIQPGPFTPSPYFTDLQDPTMQTEVVPKQKLMEETGIAIAPPSGNFDFNNNLTPQQKLLASSGINIEPREKSFSSASLQSKEHTYQINPQPTHLPPQVKTSLGTITIGKQNTQKNSINEVQKPTKEAVVLGKASEGNIGGTKPLVVGKNPIEPPTIERKNNNTEQDPTDIVVIQDGN